jgi:hypothetical protein
VAQYHTIQKQQTEAGGAWRAPTTGENRSVKPGGAQPVTDGGKTQAGGNGSGVNVAKSTQGTSTDSLRTHRKITLARACGHGRQLKTTLESTPSKQQPSSQVKSRKNENGNKTQQVRKQKKLSSSAWTGKSADHDQHEHTPRSKINTTKNSDLEKTQNRM